mgnify:CR=1 FL=1
MTISLRQATAEDAEAVMTLHLRCHEEAYGRHLPDEFFDERRAGLADRIESFRNRNVAGFGTTLAYDGDSLVGLAAGGSAREEHAPADVELYMIYTLKSAYGSGAGQALLDEVIGEQAAFLWVLEDNPRAQAFYTKNGFVADGTRKLLSEAWRNLPEIRMVRATGPSAEPRR